MNEREALQQEIEQKKTELLALEKKEVQNIRKQAIKELSEYTPEEKCRIFDSFYNSAALELRGKEEHGSHDDDDDDNAHYTWEGIMELLSRDKSKFWDYYNSL